MFRFVARFARVRIEDSSRNRFTLNGIQTDFSGGFFFRIPLNSATLLSGFRGGDRKIYIADVGRTTGSEKRVIPTTVAFTNSGLLWPNLWAYAFLNHFNINSPPPLPPLELIDIATFHKLTFDVQD